MEDRGPFDVVVHGQVTRTVDTFDEARRVAEDQKRRNPNKHVSVRDRSGVSTPEDCL